MMITRNKFNPFRKFQNSSSSSIIFESVMVYPAKHYFLFRLRSEFNGLQIIIMRYGSNPVNSPFCLNAKAEEALLSKPKTTMILHEHSHALHSMKKKKHGVSLDVISVHCCSAYLISCNNNVKQVYTKKIRYVKQNMKQIKII